MLTVSGFRKSFITFHWLDSNCNCKFSPDGDVECAEENPCGQGYLCLNTVGGFDCVLPTDAPTDAPTGAPTRSPTDPVSSSGPAPFTLKVLHTSNSLGGFDAVDNVAEFTAIIENLRDSNTIVLSGGSNYIPGLLLETAGQVEMEGPLQIIYEKLFQDTTLVVNEGRGNVDIAFMNAIGFDASAIGNHEFDYGSDFFAGKHPCLNFG